MKSFIIYLENSQTRKHVDEMHDILSEFGFENTLFPGITGDKAKELQLSDNRVIDFNAEKHPIHIEYLNRPGVLGCFYSHYSLWKKCVELNEPIFIFEEDIVFYQKYTPVDFNGILLVCVNFQGRSNEEVENKLLYFEKFFEESNSDPYIIPCTQDPIPGACGYLIQPDSAKKLCDIYKYSYDAIDHCITNKNVNVFYHSKLMGRELFPSEGKRISQTLGTEYGNPIRMVL